MKEIKNTEIIEETENKIEITKTSGNSFIIKNEKGTVHIDDDMLYNPLLLATHEAIDNFINSTTESIVSIVDIDLAILESHKQWIKEMKRIAQLVD